MNADRLRLAMFCNSSHYAGAERHIVTLLRGLPSDSVDVAWILPPALAAAARADVPAGVELVPLSLSGPRDAGAAWRMARWLRHRRPHVLHAHLASASRYAAPIARLCGVPVVVETTHVRELWRSGLKAWYGIDRLAAHAVDHFIAVSAANARYLREEKGLPPGKIAVIENGCDLDRFQPRAAASPEWRRTWQVPSANAVLLVLARLEPQKGHAVLLRALPEVRRRFPDTTVFMLGDGRLRDALRSQAESLGLGDMVRWVGFQSGVAEWLTQADATVLPSLYEGLPLAALESLAAARAVVATAVDGTPEVVVDGENGLLVPPGDVGALELALCRLLEDRQRCRHWGRQGREWVERRFDQRRQVARTHELYIQAVAASRAAAWSQVTAGKSMAGG